MTKPWTENGGVRYFDFRTKEVHYGDTALFARADSNSKELDSRINSLVENPLRLFIERKLRSSSASIDDWRIFRALHLYFLTQGVRFAAGAGTLNEDDGKLEQLLLGPEDRVDQLVAAASEHYTVASVATQQPLCFPWQGYFPLAHPDKKLPFRVGLAVPVDPNVALVWTNKTVDVDALHARPLPLHLFSVGITDRTRRVLLPRALLDDVAEGDIRALMLDARNTAEEILRNAVKLERLMRDGFALAGVPFDENIPGG